MENKAFAAIFQGTDKPFALKEYPLTQAPTGMALLKLVASGICGTDVHIHEGRLSVGSLSIIGHEFVGEVVDISNEDSDEFGFKKGDYAIVDIACPCGECSLCLSGDDANCFNLGVSNSGNPDEEPHFWGGYAQYNYSPLKNLLRIPGGLDPKAVCAYACAGPTCIHAFKLAIRANIDIKKVQTAVVQGLGPVGTFAIIYLAALGIKNIISITSGNNPLRERYALELGATKVLKLNEMSPEHIYRNILEISTYGADLVFEASGNPDAVQQGLEMLRNRGVYLIPGQYSSSGKASINPELITFKALQIFGSSQYSQEDVRDYLQFLQTNPGLQDKVLKLVKAYPISKVNEAFEDVKNGKNIKTILI